MSEEMRDKGWKYLQTDGMEGFFYEDDGSRRSQNTDGSDSYYEADGSWGTKNTDGSGSFYGADGSWGFQDADGSGSYYGADGSWGTKNTDGSGSFYGADGSWGTRDADGSMSYYGEDGAWGYKNADGSGAYYSGSSQEDIYFDADSSSDDTDDDSDEESDSGDLAVSLVGLLGAAIGVGVLAYSQKRQREREAEAELEAEAEIVRQEKEKERKAKNDLRKKRAKAFLFKRKKIEIHYDSSELIGRNVSYVVSALTENAFSNIKAVPIKDIYKGSNYNIDQVEEIVISGSSFFNSGDQIPYDAKIIITYHDKKELVIPFSERRLRKMNYMLAANKLQELGFTEIYEKPIYDLTTGWIKKDGSVEKITIGDVYPFKKNSVFPYDVRIIIEHHTFKKK